MLFDGRIIAGITVFVAVARTGSYARASELLGLSRSGVGKAIGRLEAQLGLELVGRAPAAAWVLRGVFAAWATIALVSLWRDVLALT